MTNLLFAHQQLLHQRFLDSDLGQLYMAIPYEQLAAKIPAPKHSLSGKGCKPWFDVKGAIGLLILKHYTGLSDELLIERINYDWSMQLFCGIQLKPHEKIKDTNLPSTWRGYIGRRLDIEGLQKELVIQWKPYMEQTNAGFQDATCYESRIAHPSDIKLLWQCCNKVYLHLNNQRKIARLRRSRINYDKHKLNVLKYQKSKKKTKRQERKLRKQLLKFLLRLIEQVKEIEHKYQLPLSTSYQQLIKTIVTIYKQQHQKAYGNPNEPIKDRIVSLSKPYIRPIVRGKEVKAVEFGAKVNKLQVDGISFIEHISFDAFNEGTRLQQGINLQRQLFGKCTLHSADAIYATNANRKYCTTQNIVTNFIPKGRQKEEHIDQSKLMRTVLNKERGTKLEGSFGNEKNHYLLQKVNARNEHTEKCWIFFGMLTANASIISQRILQRKMEQIIQSRAA
jgi:transposase, IS5 family